MTTKKQPVEPPATETKAAFARRVNMSRQHVGRLVSSGLPTDERGRILIEAAQQWVRTNLVSQATPGGDGDAAALLAARVRLTEAQAARTELETRKAEREVIELRDAKRLVVSFVRMQRDAVLQFASREGPGLASQLGTEARATVAVLDAAMRKLAGEISNQKLPYHGNENDT